MSRYMYLLTRSYTSACDKFAGCKTHSSSGDLICCVSTDINSPCFPVDSNVAVYDRSIHMAIILANLSWCRWAIDCDGEVRRGVAGTGERSTGCNCTAIPLRRFQPNKHAHGHLPKSSTQRTKTQDTVPLSLPVFLSEAREREGQREETFVSHQHIHDERERRGARRARRTGREKRETLLVEGWGSYLSSSSRK